MSSEQEFKANIEKYRNFPIISKKDILKRIRGDFEETFVGTHAQYKEKEKELETQADAVFKGEQELQQKLKWELEKEIKDYMFSQCKNNNPKVLERMYTLAYENGHSFGFSEVYSILMDYDDMVYDCHEIMCKN